MRRLLFLLLLVPSLTLAQGVPPHARGVADAAAAIGAIEDAGDRAAAETAFWEALRSAGRIPYTRADTVVFLYRGTASTVAVAGDLTGWNPSLALQRAGLSTLWLRTLPGLPEAARVDYKYVLNGSTWVLDPANPYTQMSGFGPNSELRMPAWVYPAETRYRPEIAHGQMGPAVTFQSTRYGAPVVYRVWTPAGYDSLTNLPVVYVTDGHEYADPALGALPTVMDNLIADGRMEPAIAVFIDPRWNGTNRRQEQYVQNPGFAAFVAEELVPAIDAAYRTRADRHARVILGTSLGGVFSTYLGLQHPDVFGSLAIQSPAYWVSENPQWWTGPSLFELVAAAPADLYRVAMSTGTINDGETNTRRMRDLFLGRSYPLTYREVPEGHSWGNWRALHDELLPALLPPPPVTGAPAPSIDGLSLTASPTPSAIETMLHATLEVTGSTRLACFDSLGRTVAMLHDGPLAAGDHAFRFEAPASGVYTCRLTQEDRTASTRVVAVR